ncbi:MAG TPA: tetratricopeptide repeat protein [Bacteroidales bacterium]|nr:tetratricopeptide repeat protein [Bacteroidales bacterium]
MRKSLYNKTAGVLILSFIFGVSLSGQDRNELINVYNAGAKAAQTNVDSAIIAFENVVSMSEKIGESANDIKQKTVQVLPGLYLKSASAKYSSKKPDADVITAAKKAVASADKYGNTSVKENATKLLAQAYNRMAGEYFKNKDYEKALTSFDSVLAINPDNAAVIYNKALIYRTQGNSDALEQTVDLYLTKIPAGDAKAAQASKMALEYFRAAGSKANQANQLDEALANLNKAAKYGEDKDLYYYFADVYNKQKDFDKGLEAAQKGLALETGSADAKAKFYFQQGLAQEGKGQTADACESFKNAMFGAFAEPSKAKRTNMKCQ